MNATRRNSLVAFLAIIAVGVTTGCGSSTPGTAQPAAIATSSATAPPAPNSVAVYPAQTEPSTEPPSATEQRSQGASTQDSGSQEPSSQDPSTQEPSTQDTESALQPTDLSGEVYGFIRDIDVAQSELTLDKVDWFWETDAEQACVADNVSDEDRLNGWCSVYYFRNVNPTLRVVSVSPDVAVVGLRGTTPVSESLQALADRAGSAAGEYHPYRITVTDGAIVELSQIYQP